MYRGLSRNEFDSGNFGQSWTYNLEIAFDFSKLNYNQPDGLVVKHHLIREKYYILLNYQNSKL